MAEKIIKEMGADLQNFSSGLNISLEKSIAEAVVNSIHAQANQVEVELHLKDSSISTVRVIDNGVGFTQKNFNSFFVLHSKHKKDIGGKGVGRATWFQYFDNVHVDSRFSEEGEKFRLHFNLPKGKTKIEAIKDRVSGEVGRTLVELTSYCGEPTLGKTSVWLKQFLLDELLVMLLSRNQQGNPIHISIKSIEGNDCIESESISADDLPEVKGESSFKLKVMDKNYDFKLLCVHAISTARNSVVTGFIAGERTIPSFESALGLKVQAPTRSYTGKYLFLLESDLFDDNRYTSAGRDRVVLPEDNDLWGNNFKQQLKAMIGQLVREFFDQEVPNHVEERKKAIDEIIELYPQYSAPEYDAVFDQILVGSIGHIDKKDVLNQLNKHDFNKEYKFKEELEKLLNDKSIAEDEKEKTVDLARKTSEQAKGVLANYFWYRKAIIDQLQKLRDDKEKSEEVLHDLFFERNETQMQANLKNCLWLLDDKFMGFSYFASEAVMQAVVDEIYGPHERDRNSLKRADMFIKYDRPAESESIDCVVIEFKALGTTIDERANAASQVRRKYAGYLRKHVPNVNNIFVYIISELDDDLCEDMWNDDFRYAYSRHGKVMFYYNQNSNAHVYFVGASTLVGDSQDRHELFFKLLKEELTEQERTS